MGIQVNHAVHKETAQILSSHLERQVLLDLYLPTYVSDLSQISLLLINDGQDLEELGLEAMLNRLYGEGLISPVLCVGIHAGPKRKMEYAVADQPDYAGRGALARHYTKFVLEELLPYIRSNCRVYQFKNKAFAGFSLGALSAMDIVWSHPDEFSLAGLFSGSFWWRRKDKNRADYHDDRDRIMHRKIREGISGPDLRFFFECGDADEREDRNLNGVIDSIDDTLDLIKELEQKGYHTGQNIFYLLMPEGRHDIPTWSKAMPEFLEWGWGLK
jgi:enterochelin esterase-like enzyme